MPILVRELEYKDHEIAQHEKFRYDVTDLKHQIRDYQSEQDHFITANTALEEQLKKANQTIELLNNVIDELEQQIREQKIILLQSSPKKAKSEISDSKFNYAFVAP